MANTQAGRGAAAIAWSLVVAIGGGLACGWCVSKFGEIGSGLLTLCGGLAGFVSRKITGRASKVAGAAQAIAVFVAFGVAETCWLHWNTVNGAPSWQAAILLWPVFLEEYTLSALVAAAFATFGALLACAFATLPDFRATAPTDSGDHSEPSTKTTNV